MARKQRPPRGVVAEDDRVWLRRVSGYDRAVFLRASRASRRLHRPWVHPPVTEETFRTWLRESRGPRADRLLVVDIESRELAGYFGINEIVRGTFESAYLGYWANAAFVGTGRMRAGLALVLRHAFSELGLHRLEANIQPGNTRSVALVRGAGFRKEGLSPRYLKIAGRWRDHERWALTYEDWRRG